MNEIVSAVDLDRLPDGSLVLAADGDIWKQCDYPSRGTYWANVSDDDLYEQRSSAIRLPATRVEGQIAEAWGTAAILAHSRIAGDTPSEDIAWAKEEYRKRVAK